MSLCVLQLIRVSEDAGHLCFVIRYFSFEMFFILLTKPLHQNAFIYPSISFAFTHTLPFYRNSLSLPSPASPTRWRHKMTSRGSTTRIKASKHDSRRTRGEDLLQGRTRAVPTRISRRLNCCPKILHCWELSPVEGPESIPLSSFVVYCLVFCSSKRSFKLLNNWRRIIWIKTMIFHYTLIFRLSVLSI